MSEIDNSESEGLTRNDTDMGQHKYTDGNLSLCTINSTWTGAGL
jgi:hypothetical protein